MAGSQRPVTGQYAARAEDPVCRRGAYAVDNLFSWDAVKSLRYRGEFATQIRDVPDGGKIRLKLI